MFKTKIGIATVIFKGFSLGEEDSERYQKDLIIACNKLGFESVVAKDFISTPEMAEEAAKLFINEDVDLYILHLGTFIDDSTVMPLVIKTKKPLVIWSHDYNAFNVSITGAQNIMPNIYDLSLEYKFIYGKFNDKVALNDLYKYGRACAIKNMLMNLKIGYIGGHPKIMTSLTIDEIAIKEIFGITLLNFGNEEILIDSKKIEAKESKKMWKEIKGLAGEVDASEDLGILSSSMLLHILRIAKENSLGAVSINCFPYLKGRVCLPVARLNDLGIPSACEGDLNSTILMYILNKLSGRSVSNGDQLKIYNLDKKNNSMMFSHCGAGAFTLAKDKKDIKIHTTFETGEGIAAYFPERIPGIVTVTNMMGSREGYRMFITRGKVLDNDLIGDYEGNPINIEFDFNIRDMLRKIAEGGFGHHWNIGYGDHTQELIYLCKLLKIDYELMI